MRDGRLRLLAVTEGPRALLPDVPTVAETLPGYEMAVWYGAFGPPACRRGGRAAECRDQPRALLPEIEQRMAAIGVEVVNDTPERMAALLTAERTELTKLIKDMGITAQ